MRRRVTLRGWMTTLLVMCTSVVAMSQPAWDPTPLPAGAEAWSLSGRPLVPTLIADAARAGLDANLANVDANNWAPFGAIAAEAELFRMAPPPTGR